MKSISYLCALTAAELAAGLESGELSSADITSAFLDSIEKNDSVIGAFLSVLREKAMAQAYASDERRRAGRPLSRLDGVPVAIKDNILVKGEACTCASRMLESFASPYDATVTERVTQAGMPILGKLNMDEFAMGSSTEHSAFRICRNPWDTSRVPGGSSGGAAAAVAAGMTPLALGSDTGGSIRQPAALCGVTGFKPAYGAVSRYGLAAFASSLDQIGVIAKTARDAAALMNILRGSDTRDATQDAALCCQDMETDIGLPLKGLRLGVFDERFYGEQTDDVRALTDEALRAIASEGAELTSISAPSLRYALPAYYLISSAEASSNLARYDGVRYGLRAFGCASIEEMYKESRSAGLGAEVKRRVLSGAFALSSGYQDRYYQRAVAARESIRRELTEALSGLDAAVLPVTPSVAHMIGDASRSPMDAYLGDVYTVIANLAGLPAISTPIGLSFGLPVGLQLMGARASGARLLGIASAVERLGLMRARAPYEGGGET